MTTRKGGPWHVNSIRQMLSHLGYRGEHPSGVKMPATIDKKIDVNKVKTERLGLACADGMIAECVYSKRAKQLNSTSTPE